MPSVHGVPWVSLYYTIASISSSMDCTLASRTLLIKLIFQTRYTDFIFYTLVIIFSFVTLMLWGFFYSIWFGRAKVVTPDSRPGSGLATCPLQR
jgi:hypothetical protein